MLARMDGLPGRAFLPFHLLIALSAAFTASTFIRFAQAEGAPFLVIAPLILAPLARWYRIHSHPQL